MGNAFSCFSKGRSTNSEARATSTVVFDPTGQQAARVNLPPGDDRCTQRPEPSPSTLHPPPPPSPVLVVCVCIVLSTDSNSSPPSPSFSLPPTRERKREREGGKKKTVRDHKHGTVEAQWAHCYVYCTNPRSSGVREYHVQPTMDARSGWEYINEVSMALWEPRDSTTMELFIGPIPNITNG